MTECERRMHAVLEKTGLYYGEDALLSAELAAYAVGLDLIYAALADTERNAFVQTADDTGLAAYESLFRILPSTASAEDRRAMLLARGAVTPADNTEAALQRQLSAAGIRGKLTAEKGGVLNVNVLSCMGISEAAAESEARAFLPAHLLCVFDFGKNTWDASDGADKTWDALDARGKTWDALDRL